MRRRFVRWGRPPDIMSLREAMDRLVEESFIRAPRRLMTPILGPELPLDVYETDQAVVVKAPVPGVKPGDLDVSIMGNTLTIRGEAKTPRARESNTSGARCIMANCPAR